MSTIFKSTHKKASWTGCNRHTLWSVGHNYAWHDTRVTVRHSWRHYSYYAKKGKGPVLAISLLTWVCDQKCFTISDVTADWHELMIPQRTMRPSIAHVSEQLDSWSAASRHTTAPISHTRPSPRSP